MYRGIVAILLVFSLWAAPAWAADIAILAGTGKPVGQISPAQIQALPQYDITTTTPWSGESTYHGPRLTDVLQQAGLSGRTVVLTAADDYKVSLSLDDLQRYQPILAWQRDGQLLPLRDRGPYWLMFDFSGMPELRNDVWYYRAIWQVVSLAVQQ